MLSFLRNGIKQVTLRPRGVGTTQPLRNEESEEGRRLNRSVTFKIYFSAAPGSAPPALLRKTEPDIVMLQKKVCMLGFSPSARPAWSADL